MGVHATMHHWTCKGCLLSHASHNGKTCPTCREEITGFQTHMGHFETIQVRDPREAREDREEQQCELCLRSGDSPSDQLVLCSSRGGGGVGLTLARAYA